MEVQKQRTFNANFKAKVALEAIKGVKPVSKISSDNEITIRQVEYWKKQASESLKQIFESNDSNKLDKLKNEYETKLGNAYLLIGKLVIENDFLKKNIEKY